jgi:hypothetical protein
MPQSRGFENSGSARPTARVLNDPNCHHTILFPEPQLTGHPWKDGNVCEAHIVLTVLDCFEHALLHEHI